MLLSTVQPVSMKLLGWQVAAGSWNLAQATARGLSSATVPGPFQAAVAMQPTLLAAVHVQPKPAALSAYQSVPGNIRLGALQLPFAVRGCATKAAHAESRAVPESEADTTQRKLTPAGSTVDYASGHVAPHPSMRSGGAAGTSDEMPESFTPRPMVYDMRYLESIKPTHLPPKTTADRLGLLGVQTLRRTFDWVTGYSEHMTEKKWIQRMIFLETVAGVPGMVAGMLRHLHSLRIMRRDKGWIHCLLEEAENERMHLLTFLELRKPGPLFRAMVLLAQGVFFNAYFLVYLLWPAVCHSFVGYLEEEAVRTYTHALRDIDEGRLWQGVAAPPIAQTYWGLPAGASMRELILAVRADEACHSHVNHTLKELKPDAPNPFAMGKSQLP